MEVTNDGDSILKSIGVYNPAAKMFVSQYPHHSNKMEVPKTWESGMSTLTLDLPLSGWRNKQIQQ